MRGHEEGFRKEPGFAAFFGKVKPFFQCIQEMKHYAIQQSGRASCDGARLLIRYTSELLLEGCSVFGV